MGKSGLRGLILGLDVNNSQDETIAYYAGYTEREIEPIVELMVDYLARPIIHEAFYKKYASKKFLKGKFALVLFRCLLLTLDSVSGNSGVG